MQPRLSGAILSALLVAGVPGMVVAQAVNEFDFDPASLAVTAITPGSPLVITSSVTYTNQNLVQNGSLTVAAGAELRLVGSVLKVFGDFVMREGSRVTVIDSSLLLPCAYTQQFTLINEGGVLSTERAVIGSAPVGNVHTHTMFLHHRGTWLARQTVVQTMICLLGNGRYGYEGNPRFRGGSVFADGLYEGDYADAIHANGMGDISLVNGTMNVGLYLDASQSTQPSTSTIDLESFVPQTIVYGDPTVHSGVTAGIANHPCRIELDQHRSVMWQLFVMASPTAPVQTYTLRHAHENICSFRGENLTGSPVLGGPWSNYFGELPGLPSTERPGHHPMPPGCSVRLGNVVFQSPANEWNRIRFWGLYLRGAATDVTIRGPSAIAEVWLEDGRLQLSGNGSFDMGFVCQTARLKGNADLRIENAALGSHGPGAALVGLIEANNSSSCTILSSRAAPLRLKTTNGAASISVQNLFGHDPIIDTGAGGSVSVVAATPTQNHDDQNLGFDAAVLPSGSPPYWGASGLSGGSSSDVAPGESGGSSYDLTAQTTNASLQKQFALPIGTYVSLLGAVKPVQVPAGGSQWWLQVGNGTDWRSRGIPLAPTNTWHRLLVPTLTVGAPSSPTFVRFALGGASARARVDGFRVFLGSWWDNANLGNLGFEDGYRFSGQTPTNGPAPDAWRSSYLQCTSDTANVRPGAAAGTRSVRITLDRNFGSIKKDLTQLRAGDTLNVSGWTRGVGGAGTSQVIIGNGDNFHIVGYGPNQHSTPMAMDGQWRQFHMTYLVPPNPSYTRIDLGVYASPGAQAWYDDITVDIQ